MSVLGKLFGDCFPRRPKRQPVKTDAPVESSLPAKQAPGPAQFATYDEKLVSGLRKLPLELRRHIEAYCGVDVRHQRQLVYAIGQVLVSETYCAEMACSPDGRLLAVPQYEPGPGEPRYTCSTGRRKLLIRYVKSGKPLTELSNASNSSGIPFPPTIDGMAFVDPFYVGDRQLLLIISWLDSALWVFDLELKTLTKQNPQYTYSQTTMVRASKSQVAIAQQCQVTLGYMCGHRFCPRHTYPINSASFAMEFSPDGCRLAVGCYDGSIIQICCRTGQVLDRFSIDSGSANVTKKNIGALAYAATPGHKLFAVVRLDIGESCFERNVYACSEKRQWVKAAGLGIELTAQVQAMCCSKKFPGLIFLGCYDGSVRIMRGTSDNTVLEVGIVGQAGLPVWRIFTHFDGRREHVFYSTMSGAVFYFSI
ncbi:MAG: WD40 repeat domain-containing protein [Myxococcota bacterium]